MQKKFDQKTSPDTKQQPGHALDTRSPFVRQEYIPLRKALWQKDPQAWC